MQITQIKTRSALLVSLLTVVLFSSFSATLQAQEKKAILVTGSSSGLGLRMTETLAANGFIVYAGVYKNEDFKRLDDMENVEAVQFDVTKADEIAAAAKVIEAKGRGLYGLVNNAGVAVFGPLLEVGIEQLDYQMDVNVYGPYRVTQAFAPMIIKSKGRIATTGSIAGIGSSAMFGLYSMSKHAVEAYTDALAAEMARFDVSVSVVEPGNYASQIGNTAKAHILSSNYWPETTQYAQERTSVLESLPHVTKGKDPQDVADAVLNIMTSDAPKRRYMVAPTEEQADRTLRTNMRKTLQLNQNQAYSYDMEVLIKMLKEEAAALEEANKP